MTKDQVGNYEKLDFKFSFGAKRENRRIKKVSNFKRTDKIIN